MTKFRYDASGRLIGTAHVSEGAEIGASYSYDEAGNKRFQTDPNSSTTEWEYDNLGRVTAHILPLGMSENFVYDPNGNVTEKTGFNADKILYAYDENNRPVKKTYPDGSEVSFTYTPTGQRETLTDAAGTTAYTYDLRDRLKTVTNPEGTEISYTYDDTGNRTSVTVPSGTTLYTYDALNRVKTVTAPDGGMTAYTYDSVGNRKTVRYPNGTVASYMYDRLNRLIKLENRNISGDLISGYIYTLGPAGNRERVEELHSGRVVNYTYDDLYRLTEEKITDPVHGNETISYTYDSFGNRLSRTDSSGTVTYTYDDNDRLREETKNGSVTAYAYDDSGNTLSRSAGTETVTYGYDYENRLVSVQGPDGSTEYACDADGIRVRSVTGGVVTNYLADKNRDYAQVLEERDSSGNITVSYVYGDDLISQKRGGSVSYYHYDGLGSTRSLTDAAGNITDTYTYEAFGDLLHRIGNTPNNYLFTGEQYDPNAGFYYLRARYYNVGNGRFITSDPFGGNPSDLFSLNKYSYTKANPIRYIDPSGEFSILGVIAITDIISVLADMKSVSINNKGCKVQSVSCNWLGTNTLKNPGNNYYDALHITEQRVRPFPLSDHNCCHVERWIRGYKIKKGKKERPYYTNSIGEKIFEDKFSDDKAVFKWNNYEFIAIDHPGIRNYSKNDGVSEVFSAFKIVVFDKCGGQKKKIFERKEEYWIKVAAKSDWLSSYFDFDKGGFDYYAK